MHTAKHITALLACLLGCLTTAAGRPSDSCLALKMKTQYSGLISNNINDIYSDRAGTIWFAGKSGLSRFDGYEFTNFNANTFAEDLNSNNIIKIFPANDNEIWLLTQNGDLIAFNVATTDASRITTGLPADKRINAVVFPNEKTAIIGTTQGLYRYDRQTGQLQQQNYREHLDRKNNGSIRTLYKDSNANIWVGTWADGIYMIEAGGIHVREIGAPQMQHLRVNEFVEGEDGRIYIATWGDGLFEIPRPTASEPQFRRYTIGAHNKALQNWDIIYSLCLDNSGQLWMGTPKGVRLLNADRTETFYSGYTRNNENTEKNINEVYKISCDSYGEIWMSLLGNGVAVNTRKEELIKYDDLSVLGLDTNCIDALYEDLHTGDTWIGLQGYGLVIYDRDKRTIVNSRYGDLVRQINKRANSIKSFCENGRKDKLYIATRYDGVYILCRSANGGTRTIHIANLDESETRCICMAVDKNDNAFVTTRSGGVFIIEYLRDSDRYRFKIAEAIEKIFDTEIISCMIADKNDNLWVGTENHGISRLRYDVGDDRIVQFESIPIADTGCREVSTLFEDSKGRIWAGTQKGLKRYDPQTARFENVDELQSVMPKVVSQITEDMNGNLWLAADSRIIRYTPDDLLDSNKYSCYVNDKISFTQGSVFNNGKTIIMGGYNGLISFDPMELPVTSDPIFPMIADILIFNQSILSFPPEGRNRISDQMPPFTRHIRLKHNENSISFKFSATSFGENDLYNYAYTMDGVDNGWQYVSSSQRIVTYSNLKPGDYRFKVRVCNQLGNWSDRIATIDTHIDKAPWLTNSAILGYILLFVAGCAFVIVRIIRNAQEKRRQYLERLNRIKTEDIYNAKLTFFTNVSHELFTPITVISCSLDQLFENNPQNPAPYRLMRSNLNRLMRLLQQIMEFSKADSANLRLKVSWGDISAFISHICNENFLVTDDRGIRLEFESNPVSITGYFDSDKLDKIMYNLISNAFKYNRPEGRVFVSLTREEKHIIITVRDTGYGIAPERLPDLFKRFYEGEYRKYKTKGTGIGLSLTNDLVKLHNGTIHVRSFVNQGSVFTVTLPIDKEAYTEEQIDNATLCEESPTAEQAPETSELPDKKDFQHTILLVEDNLELLEAMKNLMSMKYNVLTAKDGVEALGLARERLIDIVITDYQMPNISGDELCRIMRSDIELSHIPIIMLSVYSSKEYKLRAFESGADAYVVKPFDASILLAQVNSIIENRQRITHTFEKSHDLNTSEITNNGLDKAFIDKIIEHIKSNLENSEFDNASLCSAMHLSNSTLYRKIKSITGMSPQEFTRNVRFKIASTLLLDRNNNISEVAYRLGYADAKYFSTCFKKEFGMTPREFIRSNTRKKPE